MNLVVPPSTYVVKSTTAVVAAAHDKVARGLGAFVGQVEGGAQAGHAGANDYCCFGLGHICFPFAGIFSLFFAYPTPERIVVLVAGLQVFGLEAGDFVVDGHEKDAVVVLRHLRGWYQLALI